jgi:hypothetical protein
VDGGREGIAKFGGTHGRSQSRLLW